MSTFVALWQYIKLLATTLLVEFGVITMELSTVKEINQVLKNIEQFNLDLKSNPLISRKLSQFKHWYYSPTLKMFGPSKYIGYKDMNSTKYIICLDYTDFDGRVTEMALKKWITTSNEEEATKITTELLKLLSHYDKKPNKTFQIHFLKN